MEKGEGGKGGGRRFGKKWRKGDSKRGEGKESGEGTERERNEGRKENIPEFPVLTQI
jgi:hypothetical protein